MKLSQTLDTYLGEISGISPRIYGSFLSASLMVICVQLNHLSVLWSTHGVNLHPMTSSGVVSSKIDQILWHTSSGISMYSIGISGN